MTTRREAAPSVRTTRALETPGLPRLPRVAAALGMSLLLWLYVASIAEPPNRVQYPSVPVEVRNLGTSLVRSGPVPTVSIEMRPRPGTDGVGNEGLPQAYVDLRGLGAGTHTVPVRVENMENALSMNVQPPQVRIRLEPAVSATLPVIVPGTNGPNSALARSARTEPQEAQVTGTGADVQRVHSVQVNVDWQAFAPGTSVSAPLVAVDRAGRSITTVSISPERVDVTVPVATTPTP